MNADCDEGSGRNPGCGEAMSLIQSLFELQHARLPNRHTSGRFVACVYERTAHT